MTRKEDSTYESKYDELSGMSGILTTTPYGLLMDILTYTDVKIYLFVLILDFVGFKITYAIKLLVFLQPKDIALTGTHFLSMQASSIEIISSVSSRNALILITIPAFISALLVLVARQLT